MKLAAPIIAIWTPKRVAAAVGGGSDIIHTGGIYFAPSGLAADEASGFGARAIIVAALEGEGSFREKIAAAQEALEAPLADAAQRINDSQPEDFKKHLASRKALDVFFFGIVNGSVTLAHLSFATKKKGKDVVLKPHLNEYPNAATDIMSIEIVTAGMAPDADQFFRKGVTSQQALVYPLKPMQKFMTLSGAAFPVRALRFTAAGVTEAVIETGAAEAADFPGA